MNAESSTTHTHQPVRRDSLQYEYAAADAVLTEVEREHERTHPKLTESELAIAEAERSTTTCADLGIDINIFPTLEQALERREHIQRLAH